MRGRLLSLLTAIRLSVPGIVLLLFCCSLATGCSPKDRMEGYLYYRLNHNPSTLDPAHIVDVIGGSIACKLYNGLVKLDDKLNVIPDIAEKWQISSDGTLFTFSLKKHVYFSNNQEVSAIDFKYSFQRILDPKGSSPNSWVLDAIDGAKDFMKGTADSVSGISVIDRYTLQIKLEKPFSPFLHLLTMTAGYVVPEQEVRKWGKEFSTHPVGTGPFLLTEWRHNDRLVLEQNKGYFDGKAKIRGLVYRIIPEDLTAMAEFEIGNLDVVSIPNAEYARYRHAEKWNQLLSSQQGINTYYLGMNCSRPPFNDVMLRKAVFHAIDRDKILRTFFERRGRLASGPVPDNLRAWQAPPQRAYDPDLARKMVADAGMRGREITFYVTADQEVVDIAEIIQGYLVQSGLSVKIRQLEWSAYKAAINRGEADMFWISWWADYPDPENFLFPLFHSTNHGPAGNRTRYTNPEVDRLIEIGQKSLDPSRRNESYMTAERIIVDEVPWVYFWHKNDYALRQPALKNYRIYPIYTIDKGTEVSF